MNNWKEKKLKDIGTIVTGNTPPTKDRSFYGIEYKFIKPTDMIEGVRFVKSTEERLSQKGFEKYKKSFLPVNTPCVVTIGSLGKKLCLTDEPAFTNQAVNAIIPFEENDGRYIYYYMKLMLSIVKFLSSGTASGRENVSKSSFSNIKILCPSLPTQKKIADILSRYDELIENNNRRIELLEKTAQDLYKEWFVRFRFPGYKETKFINGLPKGWELIKLGDLYNTTSGGTPARKNINYYTGGKYQWVKSGELNDRFIIDTEEKITDEAIKKSSAKLLNKGSLLMAMYGATIGQLGILSENSTCNQAICVLNQKYEEYTNEYLFFWLLLNREFIISIGFGAAQQNLSQELLKKVKILKPSREIISKFNDLIKPTNYEIKNLQIQNKNLIKQRDLLLPRLMSGKLKV